jgi:hypothetical protein
MLFYFHWVLSIPEASNNLLYARVLADGQDEKFLMVTEESEALAGSPAIFLCGGDPKGVLTQFRKVIAANAARLQQLEPRN